MWPYCTKKACWSKSYTIRWVPKEWHSKVEPMLVFPCQHGEHPSEINSLKLYRLFRSIFFHFFPRCFIFLFSGHLIARHKDIILAVILNSEFDSCSLWTPCCVPRQMKTMRLHVFAKIIFVGIPFRLAIIHQTQESFFISNNNQWLFLSTTRRLSEFPTRLRNVDWVICAYFIKQHKVTSWNGFECHEFDGSKIEWICYE